MKTTRIAPSVAILLALLVGALALIVLELANGAAGDVSPTVRNPCAHRPPFQGHGVDGTVQRIVLEGLDGAACKLGTTREALVLSLSPGSSGSRPKNRRKIEAAIRAGVNRAIDDEARQGTIPSFLAPLLHRLVKAAPLDKLIQGGLALGNLIG